MANSDNVQVSVERSRWEGLAFEADLLTNVFGVPTTPNDLVRLALDRGPRRQEASPCPRRLAR